MRMKKTDGTLLAPEHHFEIEAPAPSERADDHNQQQKKFHRSIGSLDDSSHREPSVVNLPLTPDRPDYEPCQTRELLKYASTKKERKPKKKRRTSKRKKSGTVASTSETLSLFEDSELSESHNSMSLSDSYGTGEQKALLTSIVVDGGETETAKESLDKIPMMPSPMPQEVTDCEEDPLVVKKSPKKRKKKKVKSQNAGEATDEDLANTTTRKKKKKKKKKADELPAEESDGLVATPKKKKKRKKKAVVEAEPGMQTQNDTEVGDNAMEVDDDDDVVEEPEEEAIPEAAATSRAVVPPSPARPAAAASASLTAAAVRPGVQHVTGEEARQQDLRIRTKDPRAKSSRSIRKSRVSKVNFNRVASAESMPGASVDGTIGSASTQRHSNTTDNKNNNDEDGDNNTNDAPRGRVTLDFLADDERWERKMGLHMPPALREEQPQDQAVDEKGVLHLNSKGKDPMLVSDHTAKELDISGHDPTGAGAHDPLQQQAPVTQAAYGQIRAPDVEYGVSGPAWGGGLVSGAYDENLAVAVAVDEEEEFGQYYHAIEYDPDSKPPLHKHRRCQLYGILGFVFCLCAIIASTVSAVVVSGKTRGFITLAPTTAPTSSPTSQREYQFREHLVSRIGDVVKTPGTPQYAAVEWMLYGDLRTNDITVNTKNFLQRYLCAAFYFETTGLGTRRWRSCNPSPTKNGPDDCVFQRHSLDGNDNEVFKGENGIRWLSAEHECDWTGISCDEDETIRLIDVTGQNITGTLPKSVVDFPFLQQISLAYNDFEGTIPVAYASMRHVIDIELHGNQLTGTIPDAYWSSRSLQRLNLYQNMLSGTISTEIGLLTDLKGFFVGKNQMTGTIPTELGMLTAMAYFRGEENLFVGTLPSEVGQLTQLVNFWIYGNGLSGRLPSELGAMQELAQLRLYGNKMTGTIPEEIYGLTNLQLLLLDDMDLWGTVSTQIGNLINLIAFRVARNSMTGTVPTEIASLPFLQAAWLQLNQFVGDIPLEICRNVGPNQLRVLNADCGPEDNPAQACPCCTSCCDRRTQICLLQT